MKDLNYWERLRSLKMYSQQRRFERYRILYTWKIMEGMVPNCGLETYINVRKGRLCKVPAIKTKSRKSYQTIREDSFQVHGAKLFNCLPTEIRSISDVTIDKFKSNLDAFLETIPDEPKLDNLTPSGICLFTAKPSNSLIDQSRNKLR